ncbi:hypothetical protein C2I33_04835 [Ralstonia solanacearum]|nr:hypothetical protein C2I33_04835 [Ralstonia solanacearum]
MTAPRIVRVSSGCDLIVAVLLTRPWPSFAWMRQALSGHHGARDADDGAGLRVAVGGAGRGCGAARLRQG